MTEHCDVFVAGAGPAGSLTALHLVRRGLRVVLADRASFPREKVCGCCLGGPALAALDAAGLGDLVDRLGGPILRSAEFAAGGRAARIPLVRGRALSRTALDHALAAAARDAGASFRPGLGATLLPTSGDRVRIGQGDGREVLARVAVAADGLGGTFLARRSDLSVEISPAARIGAGAVVETASPYPPGVVHLAVSKSGYVGLVRLEDGRLDVAACLDTGAVRRSGGPGPVVAEVLARAGSPAVPELSRVRLRGTPPLTRRRVDVAAERLFVVGDSAGYVEPFTGEGMGWAMSGASAVAPLVLDAVREWRPSLAERWRRRHASVVRMRQAPCRAIAALLRVPSLSRALVRILEHAPAVARPLVARLNGPSREVAA